MLAVGKLSKGILHEEFHMCLCAMTIPRRIIGNNVCERDIFHRREFRKVPLTEQLIRVEKLVHVFCVPYPQRVKIFPCDVLFGTTTHCDCYKNSHNFDPRKIVIVSDP